MWHHHGLLGHDVDGERVGRDVDAQRGVVGILRHGQEVLERAGASGMNE